MKLLLALLACLSVATVGTIYAAWARVEGGVAQEVWVDKPDFHPDIVKKLVECPANVAPGWRQNGGGWLPPKTSQDMENEAFDAKRSALKKMSGSEARATMKRTFKYKLNGTLDSGYPDATQPMCVTAAGTALTLDEFYDYIQDRDDAGAQQQELNDLKAAAKAARQYLRTLKGD